MPQNKPQTSLKEIIDGNILLSAIGDGLTVQDRNMRILYQNNTMKELFGDCTGRLCYEAYEQRDAVCPDCPVAACFADGEVHRAERAITINGAVHIFSNSSAPVRNSNGDIIAAVEVVRDITASKYAEERHIHFKNLYAALSLTNKAITRFNNPKELFSEICRIAVDYGKFTLATIVTLDNDTGLLVPAAYSGVATDYLDTLVISSNPDSETGQGPTGIAFRSGGPYICNDFTSDPVTLPWRAAALKNGIHSSAAFPLKHEEQIIGVLKVYSGQIGFFDSEIIDLLQEMVASIAFALNYYSGEEHRRNAESALRESEERFKLVLEGSREGFFDWDVSSGAVRISRRYFKMLGYAAGDIAPTAVAIRKLIHPEDRPLVDRFFDKEKSGSRSAFEVEVRMLTKAKEWKWILYRGKVVERDATGTALRVAGTCSDIDEKKRYEENLRYISSHDSLTGLFNRAYFETEIARIAQGRQYPVSVIIADIDGLKFMVPHTNLCKVVGMVRSPMQ